MLLSRKEIGSKLCSVKINSEWIEEEEKLRVARYNSSDQR